MSKRSNPPYDDEAVSANLRHGELSALNAEGLKAHYAQFLSADRILLTGHSHQAWPDVAREAVLEAFNDAASHVDDKWGEVFARAEYLRSFIADAVDALPEEIALAQNTHELFTRFLSALPLRQRPVIIATDGEFHSVYRQLTAAAEAGLLEVEWVDASEPHLLAERLTERLRRSEGRCAAVVTSTVLFQSGALVPHVAELATACLKADARLFLDAYHSFQITPLSLASLGEAEAITYLSGGGYKYAQWGEGACWLRAPQSDRLRPVFTGWFSDFEHLHEPRVDAEGQPHPLRYGARAAERFAGSTFDPTSYYRAARVARFFKEQGLTIDVLRARSIEQTQLILDTLSPYISPITPSEPRSRGGFVALQVPAAHLMVRRLRARGVFVDARGDSLRFGPAPYLTHADIEKALEVTLEEWASHRADLSS